MALSCDQFRKRLDELEALDGSDMREHAGSCASCRLALERWQAAAGQMRAWADEPPPAFLHTRLMAELRAARVEKHRPRIWLTWRPVWVSAAVAAAIVVVGVGLSVFRGPAPIPELAGSSAPRAGVPRSDLSVPVAPQAETQSATVRNTEGQKRRLEPRPKPEAAIEDARDATRLEERDAAPKGRASGPADMGFGEGAAPREPVPPAVADAEESAAQAPPRRMADGHAADASVSASRAHGGAATQRDARQEPAPAPAAPPALGVADGFSGGRLSSRRLVRLVPLAGGPARSVVLSAGLAGEPAVQIDVDAEGRLHLVAVAAPAKAARLAESEDRERKAKVTQAPDLGPTDRATLEALALAPGRYRIELVQP
jgi:hypothetical protein